MQHNSIINSDALTGLAGLDDESVDCVVTSPPYFSQRNYNVPVSWDDGLECELGLESTFDVYLEHLIQIFNQVKRVLKNTGSCWVVLGDTYPSGGGIANEQSYKREAGIKTNSYPDYPPKSKLRYKMGKSQLMIPERFALKMIDNGWLLRNIIIWEKPYSMPLSAKDRFTLNYEYVYFFVKSKKYSFDEICSTSNCMVEDGEIRDMRAIWRIPLEPSPIKHYAMFPEKLVKRCLEFGCAPDGLVVDPFAGTCTTAVVAHKMRLSWLMIEPSEEYCDYGRSRMEPLLSQLRMFEDY